MIGDRLIVEYWDDLNRVAASLKDGLLRPSLLVSRLQSMQRQNPLQQALQEVGRIAKTWHILEYVDDPLFRRRVLVGLNKGETLHSLAREIAFGRQGRFMERGYEAQLNRASALSLVINAIGVWNTRYFEHAQTALLQEGVALPEDLWSHLSPFQWTHIHFNGTYHFPEIAPQEGLRPLREYQGSSAPYTLPQSLSSEATSEPEIAPEDVEDVIQLALLETGEEDAET